MEWQKAPAETVELFYEALPDAPTLERRKMFGYPCAFVNGNMFAGVHGAQMFIRLPDPLYTEFRSVTGATAFEPMPGHPMKEYAVLPDSVLRDSAALREWVRRYFKTIAALPAKERKPRKQAKKRV